MKKVLIVTAVLFGMMAGVMLLSSFSTVKESEETTVTKVNVTDGEWEDWTTVSAKGYYTASKKSTNTGYTNCKVQRRAWCGETQYRIKTPGNSDWRPVSESPIDGYKYCFYESFNEVYCFNM